MSMSAQIVMLGDYAANPFTIPGTGRTYSTTAGTAISVPGEDAQALIAQGWVGLDGTTTPYLGSAAWASRPAGLQQSQIGSLLLDTTNSRVVIYTGATSGWCHAVTGASYGV